MYKRSANQSCDVAASTSKVAARTGKKCGSGGSGWEPRSSDSPRARYLFFSKNKRKMGLIVVTSKKKDFVEFELTNQTKLY